MAHEDLRFRRRFGSLGGRREGAKKEKVEDDPADKMAATFGVEGGVARRACIVQDGDM